MSEPTSPIRIGIIGAGGIVKQRHLPGLKAIPGVELVAVCNRSRESGERIAVEWGMPRVCTQPREIMEAQDIDAVLIGTWPCLHKPLTLAALKAGKHVFTQARMSRNIAEARAMLAAARKHRNLVTMICPSPFAMKGNLFVQKLLREGFIGKLRLVRLRALNAGFADSDAPLHWRQRFDLSGYNALSLGIHVERLHQWAGTFRWVQAAQQTFVKRREDPGTGKLAAVTVPDQLIVTGELRNGAQAVMTFSSVARYSPGDRIELYGSDGMLAYDCATEVLMGAKFSAGDKEPRPLEIPAELERHWTVEQDFVDAIRAGGRGKLPAARTAFFPPDFEEGLRYMVFVETALRAARTGRRMRVRNA
jgi:predicted dehydrogenase